MRTNLILGLLAVVFAVGLSGPAEADQDVYKSKYNARLFGTVHDDQGNRVARLREVVRGNVTIDSTNLFRVEAAFPAPGAVTLTLPGTTTYNRSRTKAKVRSAPDDANRLSDLHVRLFPNAPVVDYTNKGSTRGTLTCNGRKISARGRTHRVEGTIVGGPYDGFTFNGLVDLKYKGRPGP